jgi:hypothetical protein
MTDEQRTPEPKAWTHSTRFRKVSNRYPRRVAEAYEDDLDAAMAASDEEAEGKVAEWEQAHGLPVRDWYVIGRFERDEPDRRERAERRRR